MEETLPLVPRGASTFAGEVDALALAGITISLFFGLLIATVLVVFAVKYRRRPDRQKAEFVPDRYGLELVWSVVPLGIALGMHVWGLEVYLRLVQPPDGATEVFVLGKQWMWKFAHADGRREIGELHVPVGTPIRLTITSEDVVHSFFVPAFRTKVDAVPGRYHSLWFEATRAGRYDVKCAEYCGTEHSLMRATIIAQEPREHALWQSERSEQDSLAARGEKAFRQLACQTCHGEQDSPRGPALAGLFGRQVELADGRTVVADAAYLRRAILDPAAQVVAGYEPIMPTYRGQLDEERLLALLAWLKAGSLAGGGDVR